MAKHPKPAPHTQDIPEFDSFVPFLWQHEGTVYENDPLDHGNQGDGVTPGNEGTKYGISARSYPGLDIVHLTESHAKELYKKLWRESGASNLPHPADQVYFDNVVNSGTGAGVRNLQKSLKEQGFDMNRTDHIDAKTMEALKHADPYKLCEGMLTHRVQDFHGIVAHDPSQEVFLNGWLNRAHDLGNSIGIDVDQASNAKVKGDELERRFKKDPNLQGVADEYHQAIKSAKEQDEQNRAAGVDSKQVYLAYSSQVHEAQDTALKAVQKHDEQEHSITARDRQLKQQFKRNSNLHHVQEEYEEHAKEAKTHEQEHVKAGETAAQSHNEYNTEMEAAQHSAFDEVHHITDKDSELAKRDKELKNEFRKNPSALKDIAHDYQTAVTEAKHDATESKKLGLDPATIHENYNKTLEAAQTAATDSIHNRWDTLHSQATFQHETHAQTQAQGQHTDETASRSATH